MQQLEEELVSVGTFFFCVVYIKILRDEVREAHPVGGWGCVGGWTGIYAKWATSHCSANLLELGSKTHLRTPLGLRPGWFIIAKCCASLGSKLSLFFMGGGGGSTFSFFMRTNMETSCQLSVDTCLSLNASSYEMYSRVSLNCALPLNDSSSSWWIYWERESWFYS